MGNLTAEQAFRKLRVRCGHCGLGFCTRCGASPYHVGLTCEEHKDSSDVQKLECRFCHAGIDHVANPSAAAVALAAGTGAGAAALANLAVATRQSRILEDLVACRFDGVSQFIDVPAGLRSLTCEDSLEHYGMTALTVEAWVRPASPRYAHTDAMRSGYAVVLA